MVEESSVRQMCKARGVISESVKLSRQIIVAGKISVITLVNAH